MARLQEEYIKNIKPNLMKELGLKNICPVPELKKVVIIINLVPDWRYSILIRKLITNINIIN